MLMARRAPRADMYYRALCPVPIMITAVPASRPPEPRQFPFRYSPSDCGAVTRYSVYLSILDNPHLHFLIISTLPFTLASIFHNLEPIKIPAQCEQCSNRVLPNSSTTIGRTLIMVGEWDFLEECTRLFYEKRLRMFHRDIRFVVEKDGMYVAPILDFVLKEERLSVLTPLMIEWLADTFKARDRPQV
ncbi:uncharacterized protein BT62DRAFT_1004609 [Guyanagaster necrorhizus]|uniref:Uncharacterized protein n=1 Tax=Guyanagaster necrorhizus TaxID=856835 RepID=A0A9P7VUQ6_9AGAR|nr:uncharacterized protein BT62DRAFT_1004609 [Guyanagaster necrorhizus MCA 3950]KAG7447841.1 hypothetical protein BT62DRAFT_1004609 [Guyanagaster necrorhizus MCA 3950]